MSRIEKDGHAPSSAPAPDRSDWRSESTRTVDPAWPRRPYPGLRPFRVTTDEDESLVFFGREEQKDEILRRLNEAHTVFLVGPSGCGKSSLIRAGVLPALSAGLLTRAGHCWRPVILRPGRSPIERLSDALADLLPEDHGIREKRCTDIRGLLDGEESALWFIAEAATKRPEPADQGAPRILLIVDQLEEIFAPEVIDKPDTLRFVRLLTRFFNRPHEHLYIIFAMRTGFIGSCAVFPGLAEMLNQTQYLIPLLDETQLEVAIRRPALAYGGKVEPALIRKLVADTAGTREEGADQLPLAQHTLAWLWEEAWQAARLSAPPAAATGYPAEGDGGPQLVLRLADYVGNGGLSGILERHAERAMSQACEGDSQGERERVCQRIFKRLTEVDRNGRYRRAPATIDELEAATGAPRAEILAVLAPFRKSPASFVEIRGGCGEAEDLVDISHESLIRQWPRLRGWADEEAHDIHWFRGLVEKARSWKAAQKKDSELPSPNALADIRDRWHRVQPSPAAWVARYDASDGQLSAAVPMIEGYLAAGELHVATVARQKEELRTRELEASRKATRANRNVACVLGLTLLLGVVLFMYYERRSLIDRADSLAIAGHSIILERDGPAKALNFAQEIQKHWLVTDNVRTLMVDALGDLRLLHILDLPPGQITSALFNPVTEQVLVAHSNGEIWNWDPEVGSVQKWLDVKNPVFYCCSWNREDGSYLLVATGKNRNDGNERKTNGGVYLTQDSGQTIRPVLEFEDGKGTGVFSRDGQYFVTGGGSTGRSFPLEMWRRRDDPAGPVFEQLEDIRIPQDVSTHASSMAFSHDGARVAVVSRRQTIHVFRMDADTGGVSSTHVRLEQPIGSGGSIFSIAFHPIDPNIVAGVTTAGAGYIWCVREPPYVVADPEKFVQHDGAAFGLAFAPDGRTVATSGDDRTIQLTVISAFPDDCKPGEMRVRERIDLKGHEGSIWSLDFSPDGRRLVSGANDGTVRIWSVAPVVPAEKLETPDDKLLDDELLGLIAESLPLRLKPGGKAAAVSLNNKLICAVDVRSERCER